MFNRNEVDITGNLTADVQLKYTRSGKAICEVIVAVNNSYTNSAGVKVNQADFIPVEVWGAKAEALAKYMGKGDEVSVRGVLKQHRWQNNQGQNRSRITVNAMKIQFGRKAGQRYQQHTQQNQVTTHYV